MSKKIYFKDLDALRTIAALMVFCSHATRLSTSNMKDGPLKFFLNTIFNGGTGVLIFFVLSGFLITYIILTEVKLKGSFSLKNFYIRRILRIWPLYFALLIFGFFVLLPILGHFSNINVREIWSTSGYYFGFLGNFDVLKNPGGNFIPVGITWSVAIEEQFYLVWPLLFFITKPKKYQYIFYATLLLSLIFKMINYDKPYTLHYHSLSVVPYLSIGGLAAYYSLNSEKFRDFFTGNKWFVYVAGFLFMYLSHFINLNAVFVTLIEALFFAWVILDQTHNASSRFKLSRFDILTKMGKYTYGIYMLHQTTLYSILALMRYTGQETESRLVFTNYLIGLPVTLLLAFLSYHLMEKRFLLLKDKLAYIKTTGSANRHSNK